MLARRERHVSAVGLRGCGMPFVQIVNVINRRSHTIVFDEPRARFVAFGGVSPTGRCNDVWVSDGEAGPWVLLDALGSPPIERSGHTAVFDLNGERMIVFGGETPARLNDVWQLSLAGEPTWTPLAARHTRPM